MLFGRCASTTLKGLLIWIVALALILQSSAATQNPSSNNAAGIPGIPGRPGDPGSPGRDGRDGRDGINGAKGPMGPRGPKGQPGPQGNPGPQGAQGPPGKTGIQGPPGLMPLINWKECSWKDINDDEDNGKIKDCMFTKRHTNTTLHVYWDGTLRIHGCDDCCKRWYFTFNGAECSGPMPIDGIVYMRTGSNKMLHRHRHIEGHCQKIHKGVVRIGFWVGNCRGEKAADAHTGWNSYSRIFVEEVPGPQN